MHTLRFSVSVVDGSEVRHRLRADGGARTVETTVRVTAEDAGQPGPSPAEMGVVVAVDFAPERLAATRRAAAAAISALPPGASFALLQGGDVPRVCYPYSEVWATADDMHRHMARFEAERLLPAAGGHGAQTAYADWVDLAREHFAREPRKIRHLLMITDGRGRDDGRLSAALDACVGELTCDVIGVGDRWEPWLLTRIATRLHGLAAVAEDDDGLAERLAGIMRRLRGTQVPAVPLEVRLRAGVRLVSLGESAPVRRELVPDPLPAGAEDGHPRVFTTHLWAAGQRDYTLTLLAGPDGEASMGRDADPLGTDLLLAQIQVPGADGAGPPAGDAVAVRVRWSYGPSPDDVPRQPPSATYRLLDQLADAFHEGCNALSRADRRVAEEKLGEAARIAFALGNTRFLANQLGAVAEVVDAAAGLVRLRETVDPGEVLSAQLSMQQDRPVYDAERPPSTVPCPAPGCERLSTPAADYCVACGTPLGVAS